MARRRLRPTLSERPSAAAPSTGALGNGWRGACVYSRAMQPSWEAVESVLGQPVDGLTADRLAAKARWRLSRKRFDEAAVLFLGAARRERELAEPARSREGQLVASAALALVDAGRLDDAVPLLRQVADGDRTAGHLDDHVRFHLAMAAAASGDAEGFAREIDAACRGSNGTFPSVHPHQESLLDAALALAQWRLVGHLVGAIEVMRGKLPRKLAKRIAEVRGAVPEDRRAEVERARSKVHQAAAVSRARDPLPERIAAKPDEARRFDPARATRPLSRGLFVAVTREELRQLRRRSRDAERRTFVRELEERWSPEWTCGTDKAWRFLWLLLDDPRTSAPKVDLFFEKSLHRAQFHVLTLLDGVALDRAARALSDIDGAEVRARFETWSAAELHRYLGEVFVPEASYLVHWYERIRAFIPRASRAGRPVLFDAEA